MNRNYKFKLYASSVSIFILLSSYSNTGFAITNPVNLDFQQFTDAAYYGKTNINPDTGCFGLYTCYKEKGFAVGTVSDASMGGLFTHLHQSLIAGEYSVNHHGDSAGIYIRADDLSAFSLDSFHLDARITGQNPAVNGGYEVLGFNEAYNTNLDSWHWDNDQQPNYNNGDPRVYSGSGPYPTQVAYHLIANGINGTVTLPDTFKNVRAVWIHFKGYPNTPLKLSASWNIYVDNVQLSAPQMNCTP